MLSKCKLRCIHVLYTQTDTDWRSYLQEAKPALEFLCRVHDNPYKAETFNHTNNDRQGVVCAAQLWEKSPPNRCKAFLRQHSDHLSIEISYFLSIGNIGVISTPWEVIWEKREGIRKVVITAVNVHFDDKKRKTNESIYMYNAHIALTLECLHDKHF